MFKKSLILLGAFAMALSSCSQSADPYGMDQYTFEVKEYSAPTVIVKVVEHESLKALHKAYEEKTEVSAKREGREVQAYSTIRYDATANVGYCTINIVNPKVKYAPEFIGHELVHCIYGQWHPSI